MKKIISILIACVSIFAMLSVTVSADDVQNIFDNAGLFVEEDVTYFEERISEIREEYGFEITCVTETGFQTSEEFDEYISDNFYDYIDNKPDENDNGGLFYIAEFTDDTCDYYSDYYGKYSYNDVINYAIKVDVENAFDSTETYADFFDEYLNVIEDYLVEKQSVVDPILAAAETTDLIEGYDPIIDTAELLSDTEESELYTIISEIHDNYDFDVTFLTMNEVPEGDDILTYCDWYEGVDVNRDGVVFAVNMDPDNRGYATSTRGSGQAIFNYAALDVIDDKIPTKLKSEDYAKAFNLYLEYTIEFLDAAENGEYYEEPQAFLIYFIFLGIAPAILALIVAAIVQEILVSQMKTAVIQTEAKEFMSKKSLNLTRKDDTYTHETESRRYDPPSSSSSGGSSGGGSSRSGSGGSRGGRSGGF